MDSFRISPKTLISVVQNAAPPVPKLVMLLRGNLRTRHDSIRAETAYLDWVRRFILFHDKHRPAITRQIGGE